MFKHPFLVQKRGGKFFSGRVGKHELGVGNYRQSGRKYILEIYVRWKTLCFQSIEIHGELETLGQVENRFQLEFEQIHSECNLKCISAQRTKFSFRLSALFSTFFMVDKIIEFLPRKLSEKSFSF